MTLERENHRGQRVHRLRLPDERFTATRLTGKECQRFWRKILEFAAHFTYLMLIS